MNNFYVHIIESPRPAELQAGKKEGELISKYLHLAEIGNYHCEVKNQTEYNNALSYAKIYEQITTRNKYPILHISAHGDENGFELTDGTPINWNELKTSVVRINKLMRGCFAICLSCCHGFKGCKMAMEVGGDIPFGALVGPLDDIPWDESAIGFAVFYNRLARDGNAYSAVWAMNAATGGIQGVKFQTITGVHARAAFLRELDKINFERFKQRFSKLK